MELKYIKTTTTEKAFDDYSWEETIKEYRAGNYKVEETKTFSLDNNGKIISYQIDVMAKYINHKYAPVIYGCRYNSNNVEKIIDFHIDTENLKYFSLAKDMLCATDYSPYCFDSINYEKLVKMQIEALEVMKILKEKYCKNT